MSNFITYSGRLLNLQNPQRESIDIEDIAHALSHLCRFSGHTRQFYSVAQHSVIVSNFVDKKHALYGLLHDAAEAYMTDLPRPLKDMLPEFKVIEQRLEKVIFKRFGLFDAVVPQEVKQVDRRLVVTEAIELGLRPHLWSDTLLSLPVIIDPMSSEEAKKIFLSRFKELSSPAME